MGQARGPRQKRDANSSGSAEPTLILKRELPKYELLEEMANRFHAPPRAAAAFVLLTIVSAELADATAAHFARHDLSRGRFILLMLLYAEPEHALTPAALADQAGVKPATITGLLGGLEREGYIARVPQQGDRRMITVQLLPKGMALLDGLLPEHFGRIARTMAGLSASDLEALTRALTIIRDGLDAFRIA